MKPGFTLSEAPFIRLLLPFVAGTITAIQLGSTVLTAVLGVIAGCLLAGLVLLIHGYASLKRKYRVWLPGATTISLVFALGYLLTQGHRGADGSRSPIPETGALVLRVSSEPRVNASGPRFEATLVGGYRAKHWIPFSERILVSIRDPAYASDLAYGDVLLARATLKPVVHALNPAEFDYGRYLEYRQIYRQTSIQPDQYRILRRDDGSLYGTAFRFRRHLAAKYQKFISRDAAALLSALILGQRTDIDRETVAVYSATGTTHVLSVSGMHVGIVFVVLVFLLRFMDRTRKLRIIRAGLIIVFICGYAVMTGLSAAVCRAAVMLVFVVLAKAVDKDLHNYNLLALSAFLLLVANPFYLVDAGFLLSYLAVWGLFYFYPMIYESWRPRYSLVRQLWAAVAVSLAAQLATLPLSLYYFHQFPVYFLLSNLFILVPVTLVMYLGILYLFIPAGSVLKLLAGALEYLVHGMNGGLATIGRLPGALISDMWPTVAECLLAYLVILLATVMIRSKKKQLFLPLTGLLLLLAGSWSYKKIRQINTSEIVIFNLKRHTAVGFISRGKGTILTDLPAGDRLLEFSVLPYFSYCGATEPTILTLGRSSPAEPFITVDGIASFKGQRMLIGADTYSPKRYAETFPVHYLLITGGVRYPEHVIRSFPCKLLIGHSGLPEYKAKQLEAAARALHLPFYNIRDRPALIIRL